MEFIWNKFGNNNKINRSIIYNGRLKQFLWNNKKFMEIRSVCLSFAVNYILWNITLYQTNCNLFLLVSEWKVIIASQ